MIFLSSLIPEAKCHDGWRSRSIGRQGACSHHGGVRDYSELYILSFMLSVFVGGYVFTYLEGFNSKPKSSKNNQHRYLNNKPLVGSSKEEIIKQAIDENKHVEFMYKTKKQDEYIHRRVKPIEIVNVSCNGSVKNADCLLGYCELRKANRKFALIRMKNLKIGNNGDKDV